MNMNAVVSCLRCGAELETITVGKVICGRECSAILDCSQCHYQHHLRVQLSSVYESLNTDMPTHHNRADCGTESGYKKHRREGTAQCRECLDAHNDGERRRASRRTRVAV